MIFNDFPPEIINEIYSYLENIFIIHCNLTAATRQAAKIYNINERVMYIQDELEFDNSSIKQFGNFIKLQYIYVNLLDDFDEQLLFRRLGCQCKLKYLNRHFYSDDETFYIYEIIYGLLDGKSLKMIHENLYDRILKYDFSEKKYLHKLKQFIFDVYVHIIDEKYITDEIKQTSSYYKRLLCRNSLHGVDDELFDNIQINLQFESAQL